MSKCCEVNLSGICARLSEENADLRAQLAEWKARCERRVADIHEASKRHELVLEKLRAANKRIEEAEKKEPVAHICLNANQNDDIQPATISKAVADNWSKFLGYEMSPVYTRPIPPADVAELQAERDTYKVLVKQLRDEIAELNKTTNFWKTAAVAGQKTNKLEDTQAQHKYIVRLCAYIAELERKLTEQRAAIKFACDAFDRTATEYRTGYLSGGSVEVSDLRIEAWKSLTACSSEELNKLLSEAREEGRKEAVPDGWQLVPKECTAEMAAPWTHWHDLTMQTAYKAMLAAAPSPASLNAENEKIPYRATVRFDDETRIITGTIDASSLNAKEGRE